MQNYIFVGSEISQVVNISRRTRIAALILIAIAMVAISTRFYQADAIYLQASLLPYYILFFIAMYMACILVEYVSIWCERGKSFHCARIAVHCVTMVMVSYEMGAFYKVGENVYTQFPSYSLTKVLSLTL